MSNTLTPLTKGHLIHGSGTTTVYHNRGLTQVDGQWQYLVYGDCDAAYTITTKGANSFIVDTTGEWHLMMEFSHNEES